MYRDARKLLRIVLEHDYILVLFHIIFSKCIVYDSLSFGKTVSHSYYFNLDNLSEKAWSSIPSLGKAHELHIFFNLR
jgi:hypothetical protein